MIETQDCTGRKIPDIFCGLIVASVAAGAAVAPMGDSIAFFPIAAIGAILFGTMFGIPAYAVARHMRRDTPLIAAWAGALIGRLPIFLGWIGDSSGHATLERLLRELIPFAVAGLCGGSVFLVFAKWPPSTLWRWTILKGALAAAAIGTFYLRL